MIGREASNQPQGLISVLLDAGAEIGDRGDAAMDLGKFDEPEAEAALLKVALDLGTDADLADSAGESVWEIWTRQGRRDLELIGRMHPEAKKFFEANDV